MTAEVPRETVVREIKRRMAKHPGDAPWSCTNCYHGRPCVERAILVAALKELGEAP